MLITITNGTNCVRLDYNDLFLLDPPNIFSKSRLIRKSAVEQLQLGKDGSYVEIVYVRGTKEQFSYEIFEGFASNEALYESLATMII